LHCSGAARAALVQQSPSVCLRTERTWPSHTTKGADAAASIVKEIERAGRKAIAIQADAADAEAVKAAVEKTVAMFRRLDVLAESRCVETWLHI
jgi:NAD(P)-dependent dehydrogenase (short-subunit alcohol dehydrogenase family)